MHICLHLDDVIIPWQSTDRVNFVAQDFFFILGYNKSLQGVLMDFIAFLVQKLWSNVQKLIREIPSNSLGDLHKISGLLSITLAPEPPGNKFWPLKTHVTA